MSENTLALVAEVLSRLSDHRVACVLFGGWAEEACRLSEPRPHRDIDLLLQAESFAPLDRVLTDGRHSFVEVEAKRFAHKRAFLFKGVLVELLLVQADAKGLFTMFWGDVRFAWSAPIAKKVKFGGFTLLAATPRNLARYRSNHEAIQPERWREVNGDEPG